MRPDGLRRPLPAAWTHAARAVLWPLAVGSLLHLAVRAATRSASDLANQGIYLLPLLVTLGRRDSLVRTWPAWAGVYLFATVDAWHIDDLTGPADPALRLIPLWGWLLLLGSCAVVASRSRPAEPARRDHALVSDFATAGPRATAGDRS